MKIKYFSYIAEQSFKTSPSGERLFYSGFSFTPHVIPDEVTERRLFRKQLWFLRIGLGGLILTQPFLFRAIPMVLEAPLWFLLYLALIMLLFGLANWLIFRNDLPKLRRAAARLSIFAFYLDTAKRHSIVGLVLGLLACIGFVLAGSWIVSTETNVFVGWFTIILFGLFAVAWGYTLFLKLSMPRDKGVNDKKTEAQHSVHPTGGTRRVFRQFLWLEVGSGKMAFSRPTHPQVTRAVGRQRQCCKMKLW